MLLNETPVEILRIIRPPFAVVRHVEPAYKVGMAVAEFIKHFRAYVEKFFHLHLVVDTGAVLRADGVPVDTFLGEETIMLVEYRPESVEVAVIVVVELVERVAAGHGYAQGEQQSRQCYYFAYAFHHVGGQYKALMKRASRSICFVGLSDIHSDTRPRTAVCSMWRLTILFVFVERILQR